MMQQQQKQITKCDLLSSKELVQLSHFIDHGHLIVYTQLNAPLQLNSSHHSQLLSLCAKLEILSLKDPSSRNLEWEKSYREVEATIDNVGPASDSDFIFSLLRTDTTQTSGNNTFEDYFTTLSLLNSVLQLAYQLQYDVKNNNYTFIAHGIALLYQFLTQSGSNVLVNFKKHIEKQFESIKATVEQAKEPLSETQQQWLLELTAGIIADISKVPLTQPKVSPILKFATE